MAARPLDGALPVLEPPVPAPVHFPADFHALAPGWAGPVRRVDLHCHTSATDEDLFGLAFRPLLDPLQTYRLAKLRGMDYVAITDHDSIDGCKALLDRFGELPDLIVGEEVSAVFPDDGMCVHVNVFDVSEAEHREIQRLRTNIHDLVPHLRATGKFFQLNHFTWNERHDPFAPERIVELVELFDAFEVINGTRTFRHNSLAWQVLAGRGKVGTAGSDSHTDQVGTTYTISVGETRRELLANIRAGRVAVAGQFGSPANTRRDARLLLAANVRRLRAAAGWGPGRWALEARAGLAWLLQHPATWGYYLGQRRLMAQFEAAAALALAHWPARATPMAEPDPVTDVSRAAGLDADLPMPLCPA